MFGRMRPFAVALVVAAPVAWLAGEEHRENCLRTDRSSCSVLPWDSGRAYCDTYVCVKPIKIKPIRVKPIRPVRVAP